MIKDIKENNSFRYGNNQLNTIYTAVISKSKQNEGFNFDKEICFEVPNNIGLVQNVCFEYNIFIIIEKN